MMKPKFGQVAGWSLLGAGAVVALLIGGYGAQPFVHAQDEINPEGMDMNCPMMARLKGLQLYRDSPPLLVARSEELGLSEEQAGQLEEIARTARENARELLTQEQRQKLEELPAGPLSLMDIAMKAGMSEMEGSESAMMCPMCMKMMDKKSGAADQ